MATHSGSVDRRNCVVEQSPAWRHETLQEREIVGHLIRTDVLEHANRRHRVERFVTQVAVVLETNLNPVGHASFGNSLAG